jgi:hypothetical protein
MAVYNHDDDLASFYRMGDSGTARNGSVQFGNWKPLALSGITNSSGTATATTVNSHNLAVGMYVIIAGDTAHPTYFNGGFLVATVPSQTTFTYTMPGNPGGNASLTAQSATTLVDASKQWVTNQWANYQVTYATNAGAAPTGYSLKITSNTANTLTLSQTATAPLNGVSRYIIGGTTAQPQTALGSITAGTTDGTATGGAASSLTDSGKSWATNQWSGRVVKVTGFTGQGAAAAIVQSNTPTVLTTSAWATQPAAGSSYVILGHSKPGLGISKKWAYGLQGPFSGVINQPGYVNAVTQLVSPQSNLMWGRYLYVARGGATAGFDRYDLTTDQWNQLTTFPITETLTTGSQYAYDGGNRLYFTPQVTQRLYYLDLAGNLVCGAGIIPYSAGTAILSHVMEIFMTPDAAKFLFVNRQSNAECFRALLFW